MFLYRRLSAAPEEERTARGGAKRNTAKTLMEKLDKGASMPRVSYFRFLRMLRNRLEVYVHPVPGCSRPICLVLKTGTG